MRKILEVFGTEGKGGLPGKELGKRNLCLACLAALGIILLVFSGISSSNSSDKKAANPAGAGPPPQEQTKSGMAVEEEQLSGKLCEMLKQVEGAGKVEVSVRLSGTTKAEYAVNTTTGKKTTQEKDQSGGTRLTTEDSGSGQLVMNRGSSGNEQPVVEKETAPQVAGVLVVAEGARNAGVKAKLFEATRVALGIEPHKILVLPMERRE